MHAENIGLGAHQRDGRKILRRIVWKRSLGPQQRFEIEAVALHQQCVTVGRRVRHDFSWDYWTAIVDDHLLTQRPRNARRQQARDKVIATAEAERNDTY